MKKSGSKKIVKGLMSLMLVFAMVFSLTGANVSAASSKPTSTKTVTSSTSVSYSTSGNWYTPYIYSSSAGFEVELEASNRQSVKFYLYSASGAIIKSGSIILSAGESYTIFTTQGKVYLKLVSSNGVKISGRVYFYKD